MNCVGKIRCNIKLWETFKLRICTYLFIQYMWSFSSGLTREQQSGDTEFKCLNIYVTSADILCFHCHWAVYCLKNNNFVTPSGIHSNVFSIWEVLAEVLTLRFLLSISIILSEPSLEWWRDKVWKKISRFLYCNSSLIHLCSVYWSIYKLKTAVTNYVSYDDLCRLIL